MRAYGLCSYSFLDQQWGQIWVSSCGVDFRSNPKVVGYPHEFCATTVHHWACLAKTCIIAAHRVHRKVKLGPHSSTTLEALTHSRH